MQPEKEIQITTTSQIQNNVELQMTNNADNQDVEPQSKHVAADVLEIDDAHSLSTYFSDAFQWMEPILCYSPLLITRKSNWETHKTLVSRAGSALNVILVLLYFGLQCFYQGTSWHLFSNLDNIIWIWYMIFISSSRLLSIYYCYNFFNWPWKTESLAFQYQQISGSNMYKRLIVRCKTLYISLAIAYVVIDVSILILEREALMEYYHDSVASYILVKSLNRLFLSYPQMIATIVQSIILLKYCLCLHQLHHNLKNIDSINIDIQDVFERYDNLYKLFKRDFHPTLMLSIRSYLAAEVLFMWDSVNFIGLFDAFVMLILFMRIMPIFVLYFYTASALAITHKKCGQQLWKNGRVFLDNTGKNYNGCYYNYILHYIKEYPVYLTLGGVIVSTNNVIKFTVGIAVSRIAVYAVRQWVEEKY